MSRSSAAFGHKEQGLFHSTANPLPSRNCPEAQLLLACARCDGEPQTTAQIKALLQKELDWKYILEKAQHHFITPLLYKGLKSSAPGLVPETVFCQLQKYCQLHTRNNLYLTRELLELLNLFAGHGIQALPLKGPVLAALAYGDLSLRQFADLDILIQPRDLLRTLNLFYARGYQLAIPLTRMQQVAPRLSQKKDLILTNRHGNVRVELHWRLSGNHFSFPVYMDKLWQRLEPLQLGGSSVRSLPLSDLLLFLCMHGARHGWQRLEWVCDIAQLIRRHPELDWQQLLSEARALGSERNLTLGLFLAHDLLDTELPAEVLRCIEADPIVASLAAEIEELLFSGFESSLDISYWHDYHMRVRERLRDKLRLRIHYYGRYLRLATVPTERERELFALPAALSFFYYIVRPIRLTKKYGLRALGWLVGGKK
jgi:hypothetical protein